MKVLQKAHLSLQTKCDPHLYRPTYNIEDPEPESDMKVAVGFLKFSEENEPSEMDFLILHKPLLESRTAVDYNFFNVHHFICTIDITMPILKIVRFLKLPNDSGIDYPKQCHTCDCRKCSGQLEARVYMNLDKKRSLRELDNFIKNCAVTHVREEHFHRRFQHFFGEP